MQRLVASQTSLIPQSPPERQPASDNRVDVCECKGVDPSPPVVPKLTFGLSLCSFLSSSRK